jgi:dynein heavy chain 1
MTLGSVYDLDLKKNEALIKEVIIQAGGEVSDTQQRYAMTDYVLDGFGRVY